MRKTEFPKQIKIGRLVYEILDDPDILDGDAEVVVEDEACIFIDSQDQCPGELLIHGIFHAIENSLGMRILWNDKAHTALLSEFYTVMRENGLLDKKVYCKDKIEELGY